ncbi:ORF1 protein [Cacao swollen shoot Ghana L virus]|uniref:ORF1 protein n=1 Tax=Cacao swollen shoot Ghana L virus TaxID=2056882 RepID=UPI000CA09A45|nr:ORF1 protein [Cacao swollen shoot Ghana L virus]ATZ69475.1 ORF1 protein [Cacao swollen shoot Ghana L virus]
MKDNLMSAKWENSIQEWYEKSHTANLEYLDLATTTKVTNNQLAHNLAVTFDRVSLSSRVFIKNLKQIRESILSLEKQVESVENSLKRVSKQLRENKPLTEDTVRLLVREIAQQPKLVEEQALSLTQELETKLNRVEQLLHQLGLAVGQ